MDAVSSSSAQPSWLTTSDRLAKDIEVVETIVNPPSGSDCFEMDVLVRPVNGKVVKLSANDRFCCLRTITDSDMDALKQFDVALVTRESEDIALSRVAPTGMSRPCRTGL